MIDDEGLADFEANVRALRKQRNLTLAQVSAVTGISDGNLSRMENGKIQPTVKTAVRIADALGVAVSTLLDPNVMMREEEVPWVDAASDSYKAFMLKNIADLKVEEQMYLQRVLLVADGDSRERDELWPRALAFYSKKASVQDVMKGALTTTPGDSHDQHIFLTALSQELASIVLKWQKVDE